MTVISFVNSILDRVRLRMEEGDSAHVESISVWRESAERDTELVLKGLAMVSRDPRKAYVALARGIVLAEGIAQGKIDAMNAKYAGFPVVEFEVGKLGSRPWHIYIASANSKSCLLLLSEGQQREEARRRALIWIEKCANRSIHGQPVFVNLQGSVL